MNDPITPAAAAKRFLAAIDAPVTLLVAVSGGSDSTGLLIALADCLAQGGHPHISLAAATIDHRLRAESSDEARAVAALCTSVGIPHFIRVWDGEKPVRGIAAAAREARYRLLCDLAAEIPAAAILTAHTRDDQAETIAMRAARSDRDDSAGLSGMADAVLLYRQTWLHRPFLECRRADIRDTLRQRGVSWIDDPSNVDATYERARVRARLGTVVEAAAADLFAAARRRFGLSRAAAGLLERHLTVYHGVLARLDRQALSADPAVLRHALASLASILGGRRYGMATDSMDRIVDFLKTDRPGRMTAGRVVFDRRRDGLFLMRENRDIRPLVVKAGEAGVWDGRFTIRNRGTEPLRVEAAGTARSDKMAGLFPEAPPGVARRAAPILPKISPKISEADLDSGHFHDPAARAPVEVVLDGYDWFLPRFDLELANALAGAFARPPYPPPLHRLLTENAS